MRRLAILLCILTFGLATLAFPAAVFAHTGRTIGGKYDVEVGWDKEPAYVGQPNGAAIQIYRTGTQNPVEGIESTLKVQIAFGGGKPKEFALHTVEDKKGYYVADIIPTKAGDYIFTFVGTIETTQVNEQFESGPGRFDPVSSSDDVQFPVTSPDPVALQTALDAARADISSARLFGIIGIVVGGLGLIVGFMALLTARKK